MQHLHQEGQRLQRKEPTDLILHRLSPVREILTTDQLRAAVQAVQWEQAAAEGLMIVVPGAVLRAGAVRHLTQPLQDQAAVQVAVVAQAAAHPDRQAAAVAAEEVEDNY